MKIDDHVLVIREEEDENIFRGKKGYVSEITWSDMRQHNWITVTFPLEECGKLPHWISRFDCAGIFLEEELECVTE